MFLVQTVLFSSVQTLTNNHPNTTSWLFVSELSAESHQRSFWLCWFRTLSPAPGLCVCLCWTLFNPSALCGCGGCSLSAAALWLCESLIRKQWQSRSYSLWMDEGGCWLGRVMHCGTALGDPSQPDDVKLSLWTADVSMNHNCFHVPSRQTSLRGFHCTLL